MGKIININDKVSLYDQPGLLRGEVIFGRGRHDVAYIDPFGNHAVRTEFDQVDYKAHNIIPIGSYQWIFSKMFNIGLDQDSTLRVGDLNYEAPQMKIGVPRGLYQSIHYTKEAGSGVEMKDGVNIPATNSVFGFMIGDGGAKEDNITAIAPNYKARSLFRPVPFRMSNDGYDFPINTYYGKSQAYGDTGDITSYYVKVFDAPKPRIIHAWVTTNTNEIQVVDDTVFSSTSSLAIESYVEINFSIDQYDTRGFFSSTEATPIVNELGLVAGWYNKEQDDYESIRLISFFTRPSIILPEQDTITGVYRLYAR